MNSEIYTLFVVKKIENFNMTLIFIRIYNVNLIDILITIIYVYTKYELL